jgi:ribokinase
VSQTFDIVVFGSLNMDFVSYVDHLPETGETVAAQAFDMVPGGKAANQAVAVSRLGSKAAMVGRVGVDELGKMMKNHLRHDGVNTEYVWMTPNSTTGTAMIAVDTKGQNTIVTSLGANAFLRKKDIDAVDHIFKQTNYVVLQMEMEQSVGEYIIRQAKKHGVKVVFNLAPVVTISEEVLQLVDLLIVNETEASQLTGIKVTDLNKTQEAADILYNKGIEHVIITLGEQGAAYKTTNYYEKFPSPKVKALDSTAAGDCFVAATTHFWNDYGDLKLAVKSAVEVAALSVTKKGAQSSLPTLEEYLAFKQ